MINYTQSLQIFTLSCATLVSITTTAVADSSGPTTPQKRPSHEDIAKKQQEEKEKKKKEATDKETAKEAISPAKKRSLIAQSTLLSSGDQWTLVPKGSVIHIPPRLKAKITRKPTGNLVDWKTFLRNNHGWIHVHQVTMTQAQGKTPFKKEAIKAYKTMGKIVVAACNGGPISVPASSLAGEGQK